MGPTVRARCTGPRIAASRAPTLCGALLAAGGPSAPRRSSQHTDRTGTRTPLRGARPLDALSAAERHVIERIPATAPGARVIDNEASPDLRLGELVLLASFARARWARFGHVEGVRPRRAVLPICHKVIIGPLGSVSERRSMKPCRAVSVGPSSDRTVGLGVSRDIDWPLVGRRRPWAVLHCHFDEDAHRRSASSPRRPSCAEWV